MMFPPSFLDSSSCWNTNHNQLQLQQLASNNITTMPSPAAGAGAGGGGGNGNCNNNNRPSQDGSMTTAAGGGGGGGRGEGDRDCGPNKPMSMSERVRLARVPQPEPGLNCPRCDSTNTKFCYFNNYSLTQPRHFCRACRRYWTRGGALRNVPVGGRYHHHAKRCTKPKAAAAGAAAWTTSSVTSTTPSSATTCTGSATTTVPPGMPYSAMFGANSSPPHGRFADGFDPASLGLSFPARLLFADNGAYAMDGNGHHHQSNGMEQWAAAQMQIQSFPFLHAMDHQMAGNPPPTTMAAMQGMFHLGLQSGGGGNGEDKGEHQFQHHSATPAAKRDEHQHQQQDYLSSRGMYGEVVNGGGYNFYSSTNNAADLVADYQVGQEMECDLQGGDDGQSRPIHLTSDCSLQGSMCLDLGLKGTDSIPMENLRDSPAGEETVVYKPATPSFGYNSIQPASPLTPPWCKPWTQASAQKTILLQPEEIRANLYSTYARYADKSEV